MDAASFERVYGSFQGFHALFAASFGRKQWREHSRNYLQALLAQAQERRNAENLPEPVGVPARAMQRFLTGARWDGDAVMGRLQEYLARPPGWLTPRRCGCSTAATSPSRAGSRREWPGSTAAGWARRPTAKPGCSWPASAHWVAPWCGELVEPGCTCRRSGPRTMPAARRRECRRTGGAAGRRLSWPWRCWRGPGSGVISGPSGLPETTPSGCRRPSVRDWRPWGCGTAGRSGRRHGLALGAGLDQSGIAEVRTPPQAQAGGRTAPDHGAAQR